MGEYINPQYSFDPKRHIAESFAFATTDGGRKMPSNLYELADLLLEFDKCTWEMIGKFVNSFEDYRATHIEPTFIPEAVFRREQEIIKAAEVESGKH
jgi:hypothetical protein